MLFFIDLSKAFDNVAYFERGKILLKRSILKDLLLSSDKCPKKSNEVCLLERREWQIYHI